MTILAIAARPTNATLIAECAKLGYLRREWRTLDPTYGLGTFWNDWRPANLYATDLDPAKAPFRLAMDFTAMTWPDRFFDAVVFDPPYKLNGTPSGNDERYGVHTPTRWQDRMTLILDGVTECCRVSNRMLLVKCQDQVVSGKVRWQTDMITRWAREEGFGKVDRLDILSYRPQPTGVRQVHARRNSSTLLIFERGYTS